MSDVGLLDAVHANAASAVARPPRAIAAEILDGDEVIQLSIKPSLWYIPLVSFNVALPLLLIAVLALGVAAPSGWPVVGALLGQVAALAAVVRVAFASLEWASRLYVLTNRRVLCFRGVLAVKVSECRLNRVAQAALRGTRPERILRLGSIDLVPRCDSDTTVTWSCLSKPADVHEILTRAIRKAQ